MESNTLITGTVFALLLAQNSVTALKEGHCEYKSAVDWGDDCTVIYVTLTDPATNDTLAETAMLTVNEGDNKKAEEKLIKQSLTDMVENYKEDVDLHDMMNFVQTRYECCGVDNMNDWENNTVYSCESTSNDKCGVPRTCCKEVSALCGKMARDPIRKPNPDETINTRGCAKPVQEMSVCYTGELQNKRPPGDGVTCYYHGNEDPIKHAHINAAHPLSVSLVLIAVQILVHSF